MISGYLQRKMVLPRMGFSNIYKYINWPVLHSHCKVCGSGSITPCISTSNLHGGKWLASHPSHLVFIPGKGTRYTLYRRLDWYQLSSGRCGDENYFLPPPGIETQFLDRPAHSPITKPTEISWLFISKSYFSKYWVAQKSLDTRRQHVH